MAVERTKVKATPTRKVHTRAVVRNASVPKKPSGFCKQTRGTR